MKSKIRNIILPRHAAGLGNAGNIVFNTTADINAHINYVNNHGKNMVNPEIFYSKQLLDTIRYDAMDYKYYSIATETPIQEKADKLMVRRWAPLQAHTTPLVEGIPPNSDKSSVESYEMSANAYGRYMEFSDKVDFAVVDPVLAHYTHEYSLVALETLDLLAKETLFAIANRYYAGGVARIQDMNMDCKPSMTDFRLMALSFKKALVKPVGSYYKVIASPEFYYDMITDPIVEKYMQINNNSRGVENSANLYPMFGFEFIESMTAPATGEWIDSNGVYYMQLVRPNEAGDGYEVKAHSQNQAVVEGTFLKTVTGFVKDRRTGFDASYIPNQRIWDFDGLNEKLGTTDRPWQEMKMHHTLVVGKDALVRTGLAGEGQAKMYVKELGTTGVLDPINQRQSIGFKLNSVGFGSTRLEAVVDYVCVPTQANIV